jgi:hypothetical protein
MRNKYAKIHIKLQDNSMNTITNMARQKIPRIWYYIGEDRLYRNSMTHFG